MHKYLIGIDIGTQGTKTGLFTLDGISITDAFEPSTLISHSPGFVEQQPDEIFYSVINTIREVINKANIKPDQIAAIGMDGQMAGILGIDKEWNALTWYDSWLDIRCEKYIQLIKERAEELVILKTGCPVTYAHGPKILWWKHEQQEIYQKVVKFVLPTTYVVGRLAGLKTCEAYIDHTHLHFSGFGDVYKNEWCNELLDLFQIEKSKMPEIVTPWKIVGYLTKEMAKKCSLISGIPIVAGCGDQAATSLGAGIVRKGMIFDVAGSASVFSCCVDSFHPDVKNKTLVYPRSVIPGLWIPLAYINGGGLCIRWFRDQVAGKNTKLDYNLLDSEAEKIAPGCEGLIFIPHFAGRVCPNNPNVRGSWVGLNWVHHRGHLFRSIMEGIAYEYSGYVKILKELTGGVDFTNVTVTGGGAKSNIFNSIKADVLGVPYVPLNRNDTATLGSALVAGYGVKVFDDLKSTVERIISNCEYVYPNHHNHIAYQKYINIYEEMIEALEGTFKKIVE